MLIKEASISIVCLFLLAIMAIRYFTKAGGSKREIHDGVIMMLLIACAVVHIAADGMLRVTVGDPVDIIKKNLNTISFIYYVLYILGLVGALQVSLDGVFLSAGKKPKGKLWVIGHIPAAVLIGVSAAMPDKVGVPLIKYSSLLFAIALFIFTAWFYERLDKDLRRGMVANIFLSVLVFVCFFILRLSVIPAMTMILMTTAVFAFRGERVYVEESDEKNIPDTEPDPDKVRLTVDPLTGTDLEEADREKQRKAKREERRRKREQEAARKAKEKLGASVTAMLDTEAVQKALGERETVPAEAVAADKAVTTKDELGTAKDEAAKTANETAAVENETETAKDEAASAKNEAAKLKSEATAKNEASTAENEMISETSADTAKTDLSVDKPADNITAEPIETPKPREPREPIKIADEDLSNHAQMEQTVASEMRVKPLIFEKDLKEKYHSLKENLEKKDYDGCEAIIEELGGYRISGIHVMRFERIRQRIEAKDWEAVAKEVENF